ncbi:hypothetical protein L1887_35536 [Cichorium endivia]|nr:hypothetical protein L1887_35536 [Cichorium endivia]
MVLEKCPNNTLEIRRMNLVWDDVNQFNPNADMDQWHSSLAVDGNYTMGVNGRIPAVMTLDDRGVTVPFVNYGLYTRVPETVDGLMVGCPFAIADREWGFKWCDIPQESLPDVSGFTIFIHVFLKRWMV